PAGSHRSCCWVGRPACPGWPTSPGHSRCSRPSPRSRSRGRASPARRARRKRGVRSEPRARRAHRRRRLRRGLLLHRRHGRAASLPRRAHAPPRAHQGRQPRARPRGAGAPPARGPPRRARAALRLAARPAGERHRLPARRARRAARGAPRVTMPPVPDLLLALLVLGVAWWPIAARESSTAVVSFVVYGLLLAIVLVRLGAVDVALTEAAIGSALAGAVLLA